MHPIMFEVGNFRIFSYGFMLALGVAISLILTVRVGRKEGVSEESILDLAIVTVLAGLLGARLFYVLVYDWSYYQNNLLQIFDLRNEGLVWYGGLILGALAALTYLRLKKLPMGKILDLFAPYVALGYAFGRIGCFLNGCCFGKPTTLPWGVIFPGLDLVARHPTQLYSSFFALLLFLFLLRLYPRRRFDGQVILSYIIGYAVIRFIIEFFRENLIVWQGFTVSQVLAVGIALIGVGIYRYLSKKSMRTGSI
ncbi:MAG: prolipoprotein diacylglyceryl transferase [Syntrophomonadaceae bacterium]|nr:prolipoprotein diacylglyceryl transferase [Syntrophomonadaceae bacterium]